MPEAVFFRLPHILNAAVLLVLLAACAAQEKSTELRRLPASVLADDDPCLGSDLASECSAGLLQRSSDGRRAAQRLRMPEVAEAAPPAAAAPSAAAPTAAGSAAAAAAPRGEQGRARPGQEDKRAAAATSLLADIRHLVTQVKVSGRKAPEVRHLAEEYAQLLEAQAVPGLSAGYRERQGLLAAHAGSFSRCDADLEARLETERQLRKVHEGWRAMHRECRAHEARLQKELAACNHRLNLTSARKQAACAARNVSKIATGKRNDSSLVQMKRQCQDATQGYVDQWSICAEGERFYDTKRSECDSVQQSMETANCTRASQVSGVCDMYDLCRAGMSLAYTSAKEAARAWERYHQAEWLAVVMVRCFAENLGSQAEDGTTLVGELEKCEQLVTNATLFDLEYPDVPSPRPCTPPPDSPCVARVPLPSSPLRRTSAAGSSLASAVAADEESHGLPMAVSFVQEGIEHASVALPREVHEALFRPLATPMALCLMLFVGFIMMARCMMHSKEKHQNTLDGKEGQSKQKLDRCAGDAAAVSGPAHSTHLLLDAGLWLCPELLVPRGSRCAITVPVVSGLRLEGGSANFLVVDKMGQPLFRASAMRGPSGPEHSGAPEGCVETLSLTRQDGTTLATCQWAVPQAGGSRQPECRLFQRDGLLFGMMRRDSCQVSWLSRLLRRAPLDHGNGFVFGSASPGAWQLRVQGNVNDGKFCLVDGASRVMAAVERAEQGGQGFHRLEAGSGVDVDLGLVTLVLLTVDRLRALASG